MITWDPEGDNHNSTPTFIWKNPHEKHQTGQTLTKSIPQIPMFIFTVISQQVSTILCKCIRYSDWTRTGQPRGISPSPGKCNVFLLSTPSLRILGPSHPPNQWVKGSLSSGSTRSCCEADNSPLTTAEVNNTCICTSTCP
jgi:hypothetical protein